MKGIVNNSTANTRIIFGTNVNVTSWILVKAWNNEINNPTTSATPIAGADTINSVITVSRATVAIASGVMGRPYAALVIASIQLRKYEASNLLFELLLRVFLVQYLLQPLLFQVWLYGLILLVSFYLLQES